MDNTALRQANAKARAVGKLSEISLEKKTENGVNRIEGNVIIKTSDTNFIPFHVYCNEKKNDGNENPAYTGLITVMNEYKSIADVGEEEADYVRANGQINLYRSRQTGKEIIGYNANFFTRIKNVDEVEPEARFEIETFIKSIVPELNKEGDETGRCIIKGWTPTYNGIEPVELFVGEDLAQAVDNVYELGQTVEFYGDIVNNKVVIVTEKPVAFGKPQKETRTEFVNELVVDGGSDAYEPDDGDEDNKGKKAYDAEIIRAAIAERDHKIEEEMAKSVNTTGNRSGAKPSGANKGRSLTW